MNEHTLKPCPFCGEETAIDVVITENELFSETGVDISYNTVIVCDACLARGSEFSFEQDKEESIERAVANWNCSPRWYEKRQYDFSDEIEFLNKPK